MKAHNVILGNRITTARERRGWSKAELARKAGVAPSYITRIEQGKFARPSIDQIRALSDALGVHLADLTEPPPDDVPADIREQVLALVGTDEGLVRAILADLTQRPTDEQQSALRFLADALKFSRISSTPR